MYSSESSLVIRLQILGLWKWDYSAPEIKIMAASPGERERNSYSRILREIKGNKYPHTSIERKKRTQSRHVAFVLNATRR
jgi:hypothetical protein